MVKTNKKKISLQAFLLFIGLFIGCVFLYVGIDDFLNPKQECPCNCLEDYAFREIDVTQNGTIAQGSCEEDLCIFEYNECLFNSTYSICSRKTVSWKDTITNCGDLEKNARSSSLGILLLSIFATLAVFLIIGIGIFALRNSFEREKTFDEQLTERAKYIEKEFIEMGLIKQQL